MNAASSFDASNQWDINAILNKNGQYFEHFKMVTRFVGVSKLYMRADGASRAKTLQLKCDECRAPQGQTDVKAEIVMWIIQHHRHTTRLKTLSLLVTSYRITYNRYKSKEHQETLRNTQGNSIGTKKP